MVVEQDNALAVAAEKYKKSRSEITRMKKENEEQVNKLKQEIARSLSGVWGGGGGGVENLVAQTSDLQKFTFSIFCLTL